MQRLIQNLVVILFFQKNEHIGIIDLSVTAETIPQLMEIFILFIDFEEKSNNFLHFESFRKST